MIEYRYNDTKASVARDVSAYIREQYDQCDHRPFTLAISGGSTVSSLFEAWKADPSLLRGMELSVFWVDERMVPIDSDMSNFGNAYREFFGTGSAGCNVFPIPYRSNMSTKEISADYEDYVKGVMALQESEWYDLVILGMGGDGHTSSLFPGDKIDNDGRLYIDATHPTDGTQRVALSYEGIAKASNVAIHVLGEDKREMLHRVLDEANATAVLPTALAIQAVSPRSVKIFTDIKE